MITGALILVAGIVIGFALRSIPLRRTRLDRPPELECGCGHHYSFHDPETGQCHDKIWRGANNYAPCTCRRYTGPEPLPEYVPRELGS